MAQIQPVGKALIALGIIGLVYGGYVGAKKLGLGSSTPSAKDSTSVSASAPQPAAKSISAPVGKPTPSNVFEYTAAKPVDGVLRGVVEVGASGFNSFTINMDEERRWEIKSKDFGQSLAYEGLATTEDIRYGLKKYLAIMFERGVNKTNMHFVVSSGAQKSEQTMKIVAELKKMGYFVNLVTASEEGKFALKATVPPSYIDKSFMIDIGSGNTKISWEEGNGLKSIELPGAKYYEHNLTDEQVYQQINEAAKQIPESKRATAFIIGGVPYAIGKMSGADSQRYTVLNDPSAYDAKDNRKLQAGLNIYKAIKDATGTQKFVFDVDANFTIGFLLGLKK